MIHAVHDHRYHLCVVPPPTQTKHALVDVSNNTRCSALPLRAIPTCSSKLHLPIYRGIKLMSIVGFLSSSSSVVPFSSSYLSLDSSMTLQAWDSSSSSCFCESLDSSVSSFVSPQCCLRSCGLIQCTWQLGCQGWR